MTDRQHPRGGAHTTCPRCGRPALRTPAGDLLDPEPHPLAIHRPDGTDLDARDAQRQLTGREPPAGHHLHRCRARRPRPGTDPAQLTLI